ncbi:MAG: hypothetical protein RR246_00315 [Clostridia bacterium]
MKTKIIALLIVASCLLSSCSYVPKVVSTDDTGNVNSFINPDTGIEYVACSPAIHPIVVSDVYCAYSSETQFSKIKNEDPLRLICDDDKILSYVYRDKNLPEITMKTYNPVMAYLFLEGATSQYLYTLHPEKKYLSESAQAAGETPDGSEYIYTIRDTINNTAPVENDPNKDIDENVTVFIRLCSADYPGLFYEVIFWSNKAGDYFLMDRGTKLSYDCPESVAEIIIYALYLYA